MYKALSVFGSTWIDLRHAKLRSTARLAAQIGHKEAAVVSGGKRLPGATLLRCRGTHAQQPPRGMGPGVGRPDFGQISAHLRSDDLSEGLA
jgi:hypothetical protein